MSRENIIDQIRRSLHRQQALDLNVVRGLELRDSAMNPHVLPEFSEDLTERLVRKHEALHGSVEKVIHATEIVDAVVGYLRRHDLPGKLIAARVALLQGLSFGDGIDVQFRPAEGGDLIALSVADAAIAETGTVVLVSSPNTPMTHSYLPEHHIVIVRTSTIVKWQESVWRLLRKRADFPPRGIAMISGPSKTADVEQTIEYGAHGPRNVHLIILDDPASVVSND